MMTHGTVRSTGKNGADVELTVVYPEGSRRIVISPGTTVTFFDLKDRKTLKPGVSVSGVTRKSPDGVARAGRLVLAQ
jgi:hypothetical protein